MKKEEIVNQALATCGYPKWAMNKVKRDKETPKPNATSNKKSNANQNNTKGMVVVTNVEGAYNMFSMHLLPSHRHAA